MNEGITFGQHLEKLPEREKQISSDLLNLSNFMAGNGFDSCKPMPAEDVNSISYILYKMAWGGTLNEVVKEGK